MIKILLEPIFNNFGINFQYRKIVIEQNKKNNKRV